MVPKHTVEPRLQQQVPDVVALGTAVDQVTDGDDAVSVRVECDARELGLEKRDAPVEIADEEIPSVSVPWKVLQGGPHRADPPRGSDRGLGSVIAVEGLLFAGFTLGLPFVIPVRQPISIGR